MRRFPQILALGLLLLASACTAVSQSPGQVAMADSIKVNASLERAVAYNTRPTCKTGVIEPCAKPAVRRELAEAGQRAADADERASRAARAQPVNTTQLGQARLEAANARAALDAILAREGAP